MKVGQLLLVHQRVRHCMVARWGKYIYQYEIQKKIINYILLESYPTDYQHSAAQRELSKHRPAPAVAKALSE